jgi:hypothetical protein
VGVDRVMTKASRGNHAEQGKIDTIAQSAIKAKR